MTKAESEVYFHPDRPIKSQSEDRLGFGALADNLASSILKAGSHDGFVIGIEGPWGCGKSSILNLLSAKLSSEEKLSVVKFAPWIVGDRDNMVSSLMTSLSVAISEVEEKIGGAKVAVQKSRTLAEQVRAYGALAGKKLSPFANVAAAIPGLQMGGLAAFLEALSKVDGETPVALADVKDQITESLKKLAHTFVVLVDDIDRLEPDEALEISRLIRAVGNFPNVLYVLSYDKKILTQSLEAALRIKDGTAYLQKIVQASFAVPKPEEFDLRRWLFEECQAFHHLVTREKLTDDQVDRLRLACDRQGGEVSTPREINLIINSLRLSFPPIARRVDFPDLCWLHMVKIKNEGLYHWVESYLNTFSAVFRGEGVVNSHERLEVAERLLACLDLKGKIIDDVSATGSLWNLQQYIPGIATDFGNAPQNAVLNVDRIPATALATLEKDFRLASPSHHRLYFAFAQPSGVIDEPTLSGIMRLASERESVTVEFIKLLDKERIQGGTMYEFLLDRLKRYDFSNLSEEPIRNVAWALVDTIDAGLKRERQPGFFGVKTLGHDAVTVFANLLGFLHGSTRSSFISHIFEEGKSIGWLMGSLLGGELFSHGRVPLSPGTRSPTLTASELDDAVAIMNKRLIGADRVHIANVPNPLRFFYRWQQSGDAGTQALKNWMTELSKTDKGFVELLNLCKGYAVNSTTGAYYPLNRRDLRNFFYGTEDVETRLIRISKGDDSVLKHDAQNLLTALSQGDDV